MKFTAKIIPYLFLQIIILSLIGINDLYRANWDPGRLSDLGFWIDYFTTLLATIISFFCWANIKIDAYLLEDQISNTVPVARKTVLGTSVQTKRDTLDKLIINQKTPSIKYCIEELNQEEKEKKFNFKFTNKLNRARYSRFRNWRIFKKHYDRKIERYEEYLSIEWQHENLKYYNIKYIAITESYIVNGVNINTVNNFRKKPDSRTSRLVKDNYHKWLLSIGYMGFFTSMAFTLMEDISPVIIFTIGVRVVNCIVQAIMGLRYADTYITTKVIPELDDRTSIMEYYIKGKPRYDRQYELEQAKKLAKIEALEKEVEQNGGQQI